MSFSNTFLTRRFLLQNHRDMIAMTMISMWGFAKFVNYVAETDDSEFVMQHVFTDDESDVSYRQITNKTDGAVKRKLTIAYADKIRAMRAEKERAAQLDAFNYLNGKNLQL